MEELVWSSGEKYEKSLHLFSFKTPILYENLYK